MAPDVNLQDVPSRPGQVHYNCGNTITSAQSSCDDNKDGKHPHWSLHRATHERTEHHGVECLCSRQAATQWLEAVLPSDVPNDGCGNGCHDCDSYSSITECTQTKSDFYCLRKSKESYCSYPHSGMITSRRGTLSRFDNVSCLRCMKSMYRLVRRQFLFHLPPESTSSLSSLSSPSPSSLSSSSPSSPSRNSRISPHRKASSACSSTQMLFISLILFALAVAVSSRDVIVREEVEQAFCPPMSVRQSALQAEVVLEGKVRKIEGPDPTTGVYKVILKRRRNLSGSDTIGWKIWKGTESLRRDQSWPSRLVLVKTLLDGKDDVRRCIGKLKVKRTYFFYLRNTGDAAGVTYEMMAKPTRKSRKVSRSLRKLLAPVAPTIKDLKGPSKSVSYGKKIRLKCVAKGYPQPKFTWYKDGVEVKPDKELRIKMKRRQTKLLVQKAKQEHAGTYTCVAQNEVGADNDTIKVRVTTSRYVNCVSQTYCLNNGTCRYIPSLNTQYCNCIKGYTGRRCESRDFALLLANGQATLMLERTLIIVGIVIAVLVFIVICIASYFLAKKNREVFRQKQRTREFYKRSRGELEAAPASSQDNRHRAHNTAVDNHLPNDVITRKSNPYYHANAVPNEGQVPTSSHPQASAVPTTTTTTTTSNASGTHPPPGEAEPLLSKTQRAPVDSEQYPEHEAWFRSGDAKADKEPRRRLIASSYDNCPTVPTTFTACVDRKDTSGATTTTTAVLHSPEGIEMNNFHGTKYSSADGDAKRNSLEKETVIPSARQPVSSPPTSPRPLSSASVSPPPCYSAVYTPSPSHHDAASMALLAANSSQNSIDNAGTEGGKPNGSYYRGNNHAPSLNQVRNWKSGPESQRPPLQHSGLRYEDYIRGYDSEEDIATEKDRLLSSPHKNPPIIVKLHDASVPHSNTFPKPSRGVNGVIRTGSESNNKNHDDLSSSDDENDAPREFPYQKQRDSLHISEDDLGLSKENLTCDSFSRQESREVAEPVLGLLPSNNLTAPRTADQLRKYPSEEGPAYSILVGKAQGLQLNDFTRSKSLDDPLVSAASPSASPASSSLATTPYGSTSVVSTPMPEDSIYHNHQIDHRAPHNPYHQADRQAPHVPQHRPIRPALGDTSRLRSTVLGSPMVETYGEGAFPPQMPNSHQSRPCAYDPTEDGTPWDRESGTRWGSVGVTAGGGDDRRVRMQLSTDEDEEKDRLRRLKDVCPDQPAIPI